MTNSEARELAKEADAIRNAYRDFWGAHTFAQLIALDREPVFPDTPVLDRWYPRDGSPGAGVRA